MKPNFWIMTILAVLVLGISKSGFGGGPGVVSNPMVAMVSDGSTAVAVMLPLMILCDFFCVWKYRKGCVWSLVFRLLGGFVVGTVLATILMIWVPGQQIWIKRVIGGLAIFFSLCYFLLLRDKAKIEKHIPQNAWFGCVMGVVAGICSTLAAAAGPPVQMYLLSQARTQDKEKHMGTISVYALIGNCLKIPAYLLSGAMTKVTLGITLPLVVVIPIGLALGMLVNNKLSTKMFNDVINILLIPIGIFLLLV